MLKNMKLNITIISVYFILSVVFTYPLVLHIKDSIFGCINCDPSHYLWTFWWFRKCIFELRSNPLITDYIFYPVGANLSLMAFPYIKILLYLLLQHFFTITFSYNLITLLSLTFSAFSMYILTSYFTKNKKIAFLSGILFSYNMHHFQMEATWINLSTTVFIPLYFLYLIKLCREKANFMNVFLASLMLFLLTLSSLHYLLTSLTLAILLSFMEFVSMNRKRVIKKALMVVAHLFLFVFISSILWIPIVRMNLDRIRDISFIVSINSFYKVRTSPNIFCFLYPCKRTILTGLISKKFSFYPPDFSQLKNDYNVSQIFPGYTFLILLLLACVGIKDKRIKVFVPLLFLFFCFFLGPQIYFLNHKLFQNYVYLLLQRIFWYFSAIKPFTFYPYFQLLGALLVSKFLDEKTQVVSQTKQIMLMMLIITLFLLENYSTEIMFQTIVPQFYHNLRKEAGNFAILELPLASLDQPYNEYHENEYMFYQTVHEKRILNGFALRTEKPTEVYHKNLRDVFRSSYSSIDSHTLEELKNIGLKYIVLHPKYYSDLSSNPYNFDNCHIEYSDESIIVWDIDELMNCNYSRTEKRSIKAIQRRVEPDGEIILEKVNDKVCSVIYNNANSYAYYSVNDDKIYGKRRDVAITIEFFDDSNGTFSLEYRDDKSKTTEHSLLASRSLKTQKVYVNKSGTKKLRNVTLYLDNIYLVNGFSPISDFRIFSEFDDKDYICGVWVLVNQSV